MDRARQVTLLKEQRAEIQSLGQADRAWGGKFKVWQSRTRDLLRGLTTKEHIRNFESTLSPGQIAYNEDHQFQLYVNCLQACDEFLAELLVNLERPAADHVASTDGAASLADYNFHPEIARVSGTLFAKREFSPAVFEACKRVINEVKSITAQTGLTGEDGDSLMNKALNPDRGPIKLNEMSNESEIDEQRGFMNLFKGIVGIRNLKGHMNVRLTDQRKAVEYLALCSLLLRRLDERVAPH
jgi:uncharacterized protein (TIGR02391 family)